MFRTILIIPVFASVFCFAQTQKVAGVYNGSGVTVIFNQDSTFEYLSKTLHPVFFRWEDLAEKGKWTILGDTIVLNPNLGKKLFVESEFAEAENKNDTNLLLTFNHIKRYFNKYGNIIKTDSFQIDRLDYSFNEYKKRKTTRVAAHASSRCTFAGYIPKEIITGSRSIIIPKPAKQLQSIFIGCYELQGTKEFIIKNPGSNQLTLNVYSNYYEDGLIRQVKFLIKSGKVLYTKQKKSGAFEKDSIWSYTSYKLKKQRPAS